VTKDTFPRPPDKRQSEPDYRPEAASLEGAAV